MVRGKLKKPGFFVGTATAGHQVEGDNKNSDWWYFEQNGRLRFKSGAACNQYRLYKQDIALMKKLKFNAYRFSIEFSRIMPKENKIDLNEIKHYRDVISTLKTNGIEPLPTLWHYTLPRWLLERGGIENESNIKYFIKYVSALIDNGLGAQYIITINEPVIYAAAGYLLGMWPPFKRNPVKFLEVLRNIKKLHNELYGLLKVKGNNVSFANHFVSVERKSRVALISRLLDQVMNKSPLNGTEIDFVAMNYYTTLKTSNIMSFIFSRGRKKELLYDPHEFEEMMVETYERIKKPIFITENGIETSSDKEREKFIKNSFSSITSARKRGVAILGYLHWSLLDNFEWHEGYGPKYGLLGFDTDSAGRRIKPSAFVLSDMAEKYRL